MSADAVLTQLRTPSMDRRPEVVQALRNWRRRRSYGWQLLFHQGTLFTENAAS
ncbi:hypothetical protein K6978_04575 [Xanthomonas cucurbitae]|uniref:Uncharacterized protein n=1 Tax=Xanthomonas cucurbitae TaxID=56453 RepID=A0ABY7YEY5_9XANT|nr:hypothetical protein [Xanthomonas cucurbitae]WDM68581.1 hypothetical protein K6981_04580 [Xanthomonas cucurbitae]WDM72455.1 hypothetical protein K6978_04575 [Xanthomonas cucurbitae]WDM76245.1 hypothetical protein K6982_04290 [Xanthomonas cucurbitae]WDM78331.1 hypothetical protein K6980_14335 [Xanthomonas cucurbitae]WDM82011.1 hypothetical protein K6979_14340 [Xanthomonas cucurbitae]